MKRGIFLKIRDKFFRLQNGLLGLLLCWCVCVLFFTSDTTLRPIDTCEGTFKFT